MLGRFGAGEIWCWGDLVLGRFGTGEIWYCGQRIVRTYFQESVATTLYTRPPTPCGRKVIQKEVGEFRQVNKQIY